jgi:hypothetical protein
MRIFKSLLPVFVSTVAPFKKIEFSGESIILKPAFQELFKKGIGLDVNCKSGESTSVIQQKFPHLTFFGIDGNETAIHRAKKKYGEDFFFKADLEKEQNIKNMDNFQVIQISSYKNCMNILEKSYPLLENNGIIILRYHEMDVPLLLQLQRRNKMFPLKKTELGLLENMYFYPDENTAIFLK